MSKLNIDPIMRLAPVIPVIVIDRGEDAVPMAEARHGHRAQQGLVLA